MERDVKRSIIEIEKHGVWVKDEVDKILNRVLSTSDREFTLTVLKKIVLEELVKTVSQGITLNQKLERLVREGVLKERKKETEIKLFSLSKSGE